jgi:hypothetical protein
MRLKKKLNARACWNNPTRIELDVAEIEEFDVIKVYCSLNRRHLMELAHVSEDTRILVPRVVVNLKMPIVCDIETNDGWKESVVRQFKVLTTYVARMGQYALYMGHRPRDVRKCLVVSSLTGWLPAHSGTRYCSSRRERSWRLRLWSFALRKGTDQSWNALQVH